MGNTINISEACGVGVESFLNGSFTLDAPVAIEIEETSIAVSSTVTLSVAFPKANLNFIFLLADTSDCAVTLVGSSNTLVHLAAGEPFTWRAGASYSGATAQASNPCQAANITSVTINNNGTQALATAVHGRIGFSS